MGRSMFFLGPFLLIVIKLWAHSDLNRLDRKSWGSICPDPHIYTHFCHGLINKNQGTLLFFCFCFCFVCFLLFCFVLFLNSGDPNSGDHICIEIIWPTNHFLTPYFLSCDYLILHTPICWRPHFCFCEPGSFTRC